MKMSNITMRELRIKLNDALRVMVGKKMSYSDIHDEVANIVNPICDDFNLGLRYYTWYIKSHRANGRDEDIFKLDLVTQDDKRNTFHRIGRIQSITFKLINNKFANMTLDKVRYELDREHTVKRIGETRENIERQRKELAQTEKYLRELESKRGSS
jgi:hypothetical protein